MAFREPLTQLQKIMKTEAKIRRELPTPPFFKKVKRIGGILFLVGTSIVGLAATLASGGIALPAVISVVAGAAATVGATAYHVSDYAVTTPEDIDRKIAEKMASENKLPN